MITIKWSAVFRFLKEGDQIKMKIDNVKSQRDIDRSQAIIDCMEALLAWHRHVRETSDLLNTEVKVYLENIEVDEFPKPRFTAQEIIQQMNEIGTKRDVYFQEYMRIATEHHQMLVDRTESEWVAGNVQSLVDMHEHLRSIYTTYLDIVKMYREHMLNPSPGVYRIQRIKAEYHDIVRNGIKSGM